MPNSIPLKFLASRQLLQRPCHKLREMASKTEINLFIRSPTWCIIVPTTDGIFLCVINVSIILTRKLSCKNMMNATNHLVPSL